jgi:hypothetical protein
VGQMVKTATNAKSNLGMTAVLKAPLITASCRHYMNHQTPSPSSISLETEIEALKHNNKHSSQRQSVSIQVSLSRRSNLTLIVHCLALSVRYTFAGLRFLANAATIASPCIPWQHRLSRIDPAMRSLSEVLT